MFLRHLRLSNLRSIRRLDLPFVQGQAARAWTYLLGENGTGKSSVLRSLALAMAGSQAAAELVGTPDEWVRLGEQEARIDVAFANAEGEERHASLSIVRGMSPLDFIDRNRADLEQIDRAVARSDRNYFVVGYGVARRSPSARGGLSGSLSESFAPSRSRRAAAVATLFNQDVALVSLEQWAMDLEYRKGRTGLAAVRRALNTLLPDVTFDGIDRENRRLMFRTPDGLLPLSALSDGYQAMAAWCGDLLFQITETFGDYKDPLKARGVLLVDEIDIHLHPVWQRRLVSFLQETLPNVQVLATTHSPLTIHQADAGELFVLRRDDEAGAVLHPFEGAPNRLLLPQLIESPLFGLSSLDSPQVQQMREELRDLQGIGAPRSRRGSAKDRRIRAIERELRGASNWEDVPDYLARTNKVLERIATRLAPEADDAVQAVAVQANGSGAA